MKGVNSDDNGARRTSRRTLRDPLTWFAGAGHRVCKWQGPSVDHLGSCTTAAIVAPPPHPLLADLTPQLTLALETRPNDGSL